MGVQKTDIFFVFNLIGWKKDLSMLLADGKYFWVESLIVSTLG